jgi:hypothetical protein
MVHIRSTCYLPRYKNLRSGSIELALVGSMIGILLLLPLGMKGVDCLYEWMLVRRSEQYLEQLLSSACCCLNDNSLSDGCVKIERISGRSFLASQFDEQCPDLLKGRLELSDIRFQSRILSYDPDHWMADRQPSSQPIVIFEAVLASPTGRTISIRRAREWFTE